MSEQDLRGMIDRASTFAENAFRKRGELGPIYHMVTGDGDHLIVQPPMVNKDAVVTVMKALFEMKNVSRYVFMTEAWTLTGKPEEVDEERAMREGIHDNPNREEAIIFLAEDRDRMLSARRMITRTGEKADLGPLIFDDTTESRGRMVGLLRPAGATQ